VVLETAVAKVVVLVTAVVLAAVVDDDDIFSHFSYNYGYGSVVVEVVSSAVTVDTSTRALKGSIIGAYWS